MPKQLNREETRAKISRFIEDYYTQNDKKPAIRDIAAGTGISVSSVFRILHEMEDDGTVKVEIKKQRSIVTKRMETEGPHVSIPVLGTVACGPGEEEEEHLTEYIRMPESLVGKGELFALTAKGESMIDAGIYPGDLVIVRRDKKAEIGDAKAMIIVLSDGETNRGAELSDIEDIVSGLQMPVYTIGYNADIDALQAIANINEGLCINADTDDIVYQLKQLFNANM